LKTIFTDLYLLDPAVPEFKSPAVVLVALAPYQPVTCLQPIGDTWHICRKGGNETWRHLV